MNNEEKILQMLAEVKADMAEMKAENEKRFNRLEETQSDMQTRLTEVAITQENIVLPRLELVLEGQKSLHDKMDQLASKSRVELLEDDVALLKDVVKLMRQEIADLKKAQ